MDTQHDEIYDLIAKSFSAELTEEESADLMNWKASDKSNLNEYNDYHEIWKHSNRLVLPSGIDVLKSLGATRKKAGIGNKQKNWLPVFAQIAAVLILALLLSGLYNLFIIPKPQNKIGPIVYQQVKVTYGTQSRVGLPDGTVVYLNSGSTLKFPNSFEGMKNRNVELKGEGYFSVVKNSGQPFIVDIDKIQIKVLGTTFSINAYPDNAVFTIALVEGSIELQQKSGENITDLMKLEPNQIAFYEQSSNKLQCKTEDDLSKYTAWTDGKIVFSDDPIQTVIQKLENWYHIDIELADKKLEKYRFTGTFVDEPLEQVLNILNITSQMQYKVIPAIKLGDNSYSKRKIILKSK